ncbi:MAG TPA: hypothetical protein VLF41_02580 [Candidatus Nanoarchaeia archaeon]|nr:hypothetical protein [Candidatus Nanoarchaeia archaeon]
MKDVLYLESDEEITSAIDKLLAVSAEQVSIVVPKRSTLLQSVVNQKLLKRAADDAGKQVVLVTTDRTAIHLAGKVGLAVAASLKAEAAVPELPAQAEEVGETVEESEPAPPPTAAAAITANKPEPKVTKPSFAKPMLVRTPVSSEPIAASGKRLKVPNFNNLQKRILIGGGIVGILLIFFMGNFFLKSAKVTLFAKGTQVPADFTFTADPTVKDSDAPKSILAAQSVKIEKDLTTTFTATGKKDVGTKSQGTMTVANCGDAANHTFVAGTRFQSPDGKIFRSTADVTVPGGTFFFGNCSPGKASVNVEADQAGDTYNLGPAHYTIPALPANQQPYIYGDGTQMSGGTSKQITVVTQADIDKAKGDLVDKNKDGALTDLQDKVASGYQLLNESFDQTVSQIVSSPALDAEAGEASLNLHLIYSGLAVGQSDYANLITTQEQKLVGDQNQIYDDGAGDAKLTADKKDASGRQPFHFSGLAFAGAKIDTTALAKQLAGKRYGDAADLASKQPGVDHVEISIWPGFSTSMPGLSGKIKIEIKAVKQ